jgi:hypothetical protein
LVGKLAKIVAFACMEYFGDAVTAKIVAFACMEYFGDAVTAPPQGNLPPWQTWCSLALVNGSPPNAEQI